ncbi:NADP-dependent oxidoreductase [Citricoccus sp.]|uniref:NADP-dependent oxidoreductase n=1 Tax=Citricoccus sp. TaxID=1978372 RepID=UPI0028BD5389|nr:NADP-dependent oxidoreductase [Citricoccus sp.]
MRAFGYTEYGGPEVMHHLEMEDPTPGEGQVLIRLAAAGVNPADIKVRSGLRRDRIEVRFPMAMGREAAGEVLDVGPGVTGLRPGDAVFGSTAAGTGAFAEQVLLSAAGTALRPEAVSAEQAASLPVSVCTAFDALDELDLPQGATLVVLGAGGGVGTAACGLARDRGLTVLGVASESKRPIVEELGARHVVKGNGWTERVRALTPDGVDGVIDTVGGETLREAAGLVEAGPNRSGVLPLRSVADYDLARELGGAPVTRRRTTAVYSQVAELVAAGHFTPVASAVYPFSDAAEAVAAVESGSPVGNVVVSGVESADHRP